MSNIHAESKLKVYLESLSGLSPAPGGGSASALIGALGVSELMMVCAYTLENKRYEKQHEFIGPLDRAFAQMKEKMTFLIDEDSRVYAEYVKALEDKKNIKRIKRSVKKITDVPLEICRLASGAADHCGDMLKYGNPYLKSDIYCGYYALRCAYYSARVNVQTNLKSKYVAHDIAKIEKWLHQKEKIFKKLDRTFIKFK